MSKRAFRRHHRARMVARTRRILKAYDWPDTYIEHASIRRADNFTVCSCRMCGNPRRSKGWENPLSIQEQRAALDSVDIPYSEEE